MASAVSYLEVGATDPPYTPTYPRIDPFGVQGRRVRQDLEVVEVPVVAVHDGHEGEGGRGEARDVLGSGRRLGQLASDSAANGRE